jgi:hypothetical protein
MDYFVGFLAGLVVGGVAGAIVGAGIYSTALQAALNLAVMRSGVEYGGGSRVIVEPSRPQQAYTAPVVMPQTPTVNVTADASPPQPII